MRLRVENNFTKIAQMIPAIETETLLKTGSDVALLAKQLSPVDTGALRDSIGAIPVSSNEVHVGTDREYGPVVELGGPFTAAQPYLTPAAAQGEEIFRKRFAEVAEAQLPK